MMRRKQHLPRFVPGLFSTRAAHEAALDATDRIGRASGPLTYDMIVPPLRHHAERLFAALTAARRSRDRGTLGLWTWASGLTHRVDGRAPYKADDHKAVFAKLSCGFILVSPIEPWAGGGWQASLLLRDAEGRASEHALICKRTGKLVVFGDRFDAVARLTATVMAMGEPPSGQQWDGAPALPTCWTVTGDDAEARTVDRQGRPWLIHGTRFGFVLRCTKVKFGSDYIALDAARFLAMLGGLMKHIPLGPGEFETQGAIAHVALEAKALTLDYLKGATLSTTAFARAAYALTLKGIDPTAAIGRGISAVVANFPAAERSRFCDVLMELLFRPIFRGMAIAAVLDLVKGLGDSLTGLRDAAEGNAPPTAPTAQAASKRVADAIFAGLRLGIERALLQATLDHWRDLHGGPEIKLNPLDPSDGGYFPPYPQLITADQVNAW